MPIVLPIVLQGATGPFLLNGTVLAEIGLAREFAELGYPVSSPSVVEPAAGDLASVSAAPLT